MPQQGGWPTQARPLAQTTYLEASLGLAQSGIEKWTVDTSRMTMTFYDKAGSEMLVEQISYLGFHRGLE
jgi:uncharacterized protein YbcV (DUF1398 family)